jgi:putative sterol carrier protein
MSEIEKVFKGLPKRFNKDNVKKPRTFYFSLGEDEKWTVELRLDRCTITKGKPAEDVDCFFKASEETFLEVWNGKKTPNAKDFLTGTIRSNNPMLLKEFVEAFRK